MTVLRYCAGAGLLVGKKYPLTHGVHEFHSALAVQLLGCANLWCPRCKAPVRVEPGWTPEQQANRHYECDCESWDEGYVRSLAPESDDLVFPWECAGHPVAELPLSLDGVEISDASLPAVVQEALRGQVPAQARPEERSAPAGWVLKLYLLLDGTSPAVTVGQVVAAGLTDPDPVVRLGALRFFARAPGAPGAERIEELVLAKDRRLYQGVPDPTGLGDWDLEGWLRAALASRVGLVDEAGAPLFAQARELAQVEALSRGVVEGMAFALYEADPPWFREHAVEIVRRTPEALADVLTALDTESALALSPRLVSLREVDADEAQRCAREGASPARGRVIRAALRERAAALAAGWAARSPDFQRFVHSIDAPITSRGQAEALDLVALGRLVGEERAEAERLLRRELQRCADPRLEDALDFLTAQ